MTERRRPALRPRDAERLRTLSAGVMGGVPGSVPVSASGNGASVPSSIPVVPYNPIHAPTAIDFPNPPTGGGGAPPDAPRFSWGGIVNFVRRTPVWRVLVDADLAEVDVDMPFSTAAINFGIRVNGVTIDTVAATATAFATYAITVPVVAGDRVQIDLTSIGTGACIGLSMLLREAD